MAETGDISTHLGDLFTLDGNQLLIQVALLLHVQPWYLFGFPAGIRFNR
jgi:hypothetical protein